MKQFLKMLILFVIGGMMYGLIEIVARGYTHYSMLILGGICFIIIGFLNEGFTWEMSITSQMFIGSIVITVLEFIAGCILNLWLGWEIWDYSHMPYNLLGQINALHSFYWFLLSGVAVVLDDCLRAWLFNEKQQKYHL